MYTRNYYSEDEKIRVPENYDGNAFTEAKETADAPEVQKSVKTDTESPPLRAPWDVASEERKEVAEEVMAKPRENVGAFFDFMSKLPFKSVFKKDNFLRNTISDFGTEELLIIGLATFLLLSKNGDKECAFILLFLLFVK